MKDDLLFKEKLERAAKVEENNLENFLTYDNISYQKMVVDAMRYSVFAGGKRLRPVLMRQTYSLFTGLSEEYGNIDVGKTAVVNSFAAAIEMIHTYSLIHDDLPAMDDDDFRRGNPTCHKKYPEAIAILAGDGLLNLAFETMLGASRISSDTILKASRVLANRAGIYGMIGGQVADVLYEDKASSETSIEELKFIHVHKTAALISAAMEIGAIFAKASDEDLSDIRLVANKVGLAFQIEDDILDITSTDEVLGKPTGSDDKNDKLTYVSYVGLDEAKKTARQLVDDALSTFDALCNRSDLHGEFLRDILLYLFERER